MDVYHVKRIAQFPYVRAESMFLPGNGKEDLVSTSLLVIGATGGAGSEVMRSALARGWQVRTFGRRRPSQDGIDHVAGDALDAAALRRAARGADVVFHGANPPRYQRWQTLVPAMLENAIEAARAADARLILPGNVYNFGPDAFPVLHEGAPQQPVSRKGRVRVALEDMLRRATEDGMRATVLRAGDFFGPHAPASWLTSVMLRPGKPPRRIIYPGEPAAGHAWAYLPDYGEAVARLIAAEDALQRFETLHFAGHYFEHGVAFAEALARTAGLPPEAVRPFAWPAVRLLSPFVPLFREILEMRYLWQQPLALDNSRLVRLIGAEPQTPLDQALGDTLAGLGCLPLFRGPAHRIEWRATMGRMQHGSQPDGGRP